jgi:hypothetical protein
MDHILWLGSAFGAILGMLHGTYLYRQQAACALASGTTGGRAIGLYYGLWAFALWTLFGAWVLGSIAYLVARLVPGRRTAR